MSLTSNYNKEEPLNFEMKVPNTRFINFTATWVFSPAFIRLYFYMLLQPLGEEDLKKLFGEKRVAEFKHVVGPKKVEEVVHSNGVASAEGVEEFKDNPNNLENNWIFSEKDFLSLLYPLIADFLQNDVEEFCEVAKLVEDLREVIKFQKILTQEKNQLVFYAMALHSALGLKYLVQSTRIIPIPNSYASMGTVFAKLFRQRLDKIENQLSANQNLIELLNRGRISPEMIEYYDRLFLELQKDTTQLSPKEDNRVFILILHIFLHFLGKKYVEFVEKVFGEKKNEKI
uniref:Uncharacterized protein n=1 Tax=Cyphia bulbosa var. bulbosa TaxID=2041115 RepID=A0A291F380_9ASTR|nr:hypothetical protein Cyp_bu_bu1Pt0174 [Cyphia bulbosa var. bulbosa]